VIISAGRSRSVTVRGLTTVREPAYFSPNRRAAQHNATLGHSLRLYNAKTRRVLVFICEIGGLGNIMPEQNRSGTSGPEILWRELVASLAIPDPAESLFVKRYWLSFLQSVRPFRVNLCASTRVVPLVSHERVIMNLSSETPREYKCQHQAKTVLCS
jgi:hypothetical protein